MNDPKAERLNFWENRSGLGFAAGSGDINLKKLEIDAICNAINNPRFVLDAGCGNGITLSHLAETFSDAHFYGFDYSQGMVDATKQLIAERNIADRARVCKASLLDHLEISLAEINIPEHGFDHIYTERSLINLDTLDEQSKAIKSLWKLLSPGGKLILCEAFHDGLDEINAYREAVDLQNISPPWHNRYLSLSEIKDLAPASAKAHEIIEFSGTYYFISRIIHARDAYLKGENPSYDSTINKQSLDLPSLPMFGQSKIVILNKP